MCRPVAVGPGTRNTSDQLNIYLDYQADTCPGTVHSAYAIDQLILGVLHGYVAIVAALVLPSRPAIHSPLEVTVGDGCRAEDASLAQEGGSHGRIHLEDLATDRTAKRDQDVFGRHRQKNSVAYRWLVNREWFPVWPSRLVIVSQSSQPVQP